LHRHRHTDRGGAHCAATAGRRNPARPRRTLRGTRDLLGKQGWPAQKNRRADECGQSGWAL